jgi:hypothetical protein
MNDIKKISDGGMNLFYVVAKTDTGTTVVYSGLFKIFDTAQNIENLRNLANQAAQDSFVVLDETRTGGVADVTRRTVTQTIPPNAVKLSDLVNKKNATTPQSNNTSESKTTTDTSAQSVYIQNKTIYQINTDSSFSINNYPFTAQNIKAVLNLPIVPTELTFKGDSIYSKGGLLDKTTALYKKLVNKYITPNAEIKAVFEQIQKDFLEREYGETIQTPFDQEAKNLAEKQNKVEKIKSNTDGSKSGKLKGKLGK